MHRERGSADRAVEWPQLRVHHRRHAARRRKELEAVLERLEENVAKDSKGACQNDFLRVKGAVQLVEGQPERRRDPVQETQHDLVPGQRGLEQGFHGRLGLGGSL